MYFCLLGNLLMQCTGNRQTWIRKKYTIFHIYLSIYVVQYISSFMELALYNILLCVVCHLIVRGFSSVWVPNVILLQPLYTYKHTLSELSAVQPYTCLYIRTISFRMVIYNTHVHVYCVWNSKVASMVHIQGTGTGVKAFEEIEDKGIRF